MKRDIVNFKHLKWQLQLEETGIKMVLSSFCMMLEVLCAPKLHFLIHENIHDNVIREPTVQGCIQEDHLEWCVFCESF